MRHVMLIVLLAATAACHLQAGTPTPYPTPDVPSVSFQSPANNDSFPEGTDLTIALLAEDPGVGVSRVELLVDDVHYRDGNPEISAAVPVFTVTLNWLAEGVGYHSLTAIAYRPNGAASRQETIIIEVTRADDA